MFYLKRVISHSLVDVMNFDIPLAGWVLSAIAFVLGTIVPTLYSWLSYEGISIKQLNHRLVSQEENEKGEDLLVFSTLFKIANVKKESVLIDNIRIKAPSFKLNDITFELNRIDLKFYEPDADKYLPPSNAPDRRLDHLPLIVKSDEFKTCGIGVWFQYKPKNSDNATKILADFIESKGLHIAFRVNGKYRDYILQIQPEQFN